MSALCSAALRSDSRLPLPAKNQVSYPDLTINLTNYSVTYMGKQVDMPPKELELLYFLASSPNQVFTREQLLDHIWGYEYIGDTRTVDVHIKRLREKSKIIQLEHCNCVGHRIQIRGKKQMKKKLSRKFMEVYLFVGSPWFSAGYAAGFPYDRISAGKRYQRRSLSECLPDLRK